MGRSKKNRRNRSDNLYPPGYGNYMVPYTNPYGYTNGYGPGFHYGVADPESIQKIADRIFGGRYYCVGDRKKGSVETRKD